MTKIDTSTEAVEALLAERDDYKSRFESMYDLAKALSGAFADSSNENADLKAKLAEAQAERDALKAALADARDMRRIIALFDKG